MSISTYSMLKNVFVHWNIAKNSFDKNIGYQCLDAEIRLIWECNARCKMCGLGDYIYKNDQNRKNNLNSDEIKSVIEDLKKLGCKNLTLSGGEPTLSTILIDIIKFAVERGIQTALNTNGFLLDQEYIERLIAAGLRVFTFSIDSPIEKQHDEIRGLKGCFQRAVKAIDIINDWNKKSERKVYILINCVLLKENIRYMHKFIDFYEKHPFHHLTLSPASIGTKWDQWSTMNEELRTDIEDVKYFKQKVFPDLKKYNWPFEIIDPYEDEKNIANNIHSVYSYIPDKCFVPFLHMVVQSNGDVIPCCYADDRFLMGNVRRNSLTEIWNNEKYKEFRNNAKGFKQMEMCQSCRQYIKINYEINQKMEREVNLYEQNGN